MQQIPVKQLSTKLFSHMPSVPILMIEILGSVLLASQALPRTLGNRKMLAENLGSGVWHVLAMCSTSLAACSLALQKVAGRQ